MRLSVSTYSLANWRKTGGRSLDDALAWLADLGVGGVVLAGLEAESEDDLIPRARAVRRQCEKLGLAVCGYTVPAELYGKPDAVKQALATTKKHIDAAAELELTHMRHDVTRGPAVAKGQGGSKPSFHEVVAALVPAVRELADYGAERGVCTSLENHGFYLQKATRVQRLLRAVDHENFRLTLDLGNFLCVNDDPVAAAERLAPWAVAVHAKDFHIKPKKHVPPPADDALGELGDGWIRTPTAIAIRGAVLGHGAVNVPAQLKLLKKAGYDGDLTLEFEGLEDSAVGVRLGLAYLRQQCAKLSIPLA